MKEDDMNKIANWINQTMELIKDAPKNFEEFKTFLQQPNTQFDQVANEVKTFALEFPVPGLDN